MVKKKDNGKYDVRTSTGDIVEMSWLELCEIANFVSEKETEDEVENYLKDMHEVCDTNCEWLESPGFVSEIVESVIAGRVTEESTDDIYYAVSDILNTLHDVIEIFGRKALLVYSNMMGVPDGLYKYNLRGHYEDKLILTDISESDKEGHHWTVITQEPLELGENGTASFTEETQPKFLGYQMTLSVFLTAKKIMEEIESDVDAVFLPGTVHGCPDQLYIYYLNPCACDGRGSWDIEIIDWETVLELYEEVNGDVDDFFALLPDRYHGRWCYCDYLHEEFESYAFSFNKADFIVGRDGSVDDELDFIIKWAKQKQADNYTK